MSLLASVSMIMPLTPRSHTVWPEHITGQEGGGKERAGGGRAGGRHTGEEGERERALFLCLCLFHPVKKTKQKTKLGGIG